MGRRITTRHKFDCDKSMVKGIKRLNKLGFLTLGCCSGLEKEHPNNERRRLYVLFGEIPLDKQTYLKSVAKRFGFVVRNNNGFLRIEKESNDKLSCFYKIVREIATYGKLDLRAMGLSNWCYNPETKERYSIQFYDWDNTDKLDLRKNINKILDIFPYDCVMYETKHGVHFISFALLKGIHTTKARCLKTTKLFNQSQDYWTTSKDLTLRVSPKWDEKRNIVSDKPKFKGVAKFPNGYRISKNHLEFYKRYMGLPDWVYRLYNDCDKRDLKIKVYHYKTAN